MFRWLNAAVASDIHDVTSKDYTLPFTEVKVQLSLYLIKHHAMKTYWGSAGIAPSIL